MSAQSGPDVTALLAEHRLKWNPGHYGSLGTHACTGTLPTCRLYRDSEDRESEHRAHLDQVIREAYADWVDEMARRAFVATPATTPGFAVLTALADLLRGQA